MKFPTTRRELIDKLQLTVIAFDDSLEVKTLFPIKPLTSQKYTSPSQGEGDTGGEVKEFQKGIYGENTKR